MANIKIKAKEKGGLIKVTSLIKHEMTTYNQAKAKTGDANNANFITSITASVNDELVYEASTSQFLSVNPILKFKFKGAVKGDTVVMVYTDKSGNTKTSKTKIK